MERNTLSTGKTGISLDIIFPIFFVGVSICLAFIWKGLQSFAGFLVWLVIGGLLLAAIYFGIRSTQANLVTTLKRILEVDNG